MLWLTKVFNVSNIKLMEFSSIIPPDVAYNSSKEDFEELNILKDEKEIIALCMRSYIHFLKMNKSLLLNHNYNQKIQIHP